MNRTAPPGGATPPELFELSGGERVDLGRLSRILSDLYFARYPEPDEEKAAIERAWCEHDSRYILAWALEDARAQTVDCVEQVRWLGRVLEARGFPVERLIVHLELASSMLVALVDEVGIAASERLLASANALAQDHLDEDRVEP